MWQGARTISPFLRSDRALKEGSPRCGFAFGSPIAWRIILPQAGGSAFIVPFRRDGLQSSISGARTASNKALKKVEEKDSCITVVQTAKVMEHKGPIVIRVFLIFLWALGLWLFVFANGFNVDETTRASYDLTLRMSQEIERVELVVAETVKSRAYVEYYNHKGWFSCDAQCLRDYNKYIMAKANVERVQNEVDRILSEARKEVGIWSVFGIADVRAGFWRAWKWGKDTATRATTYDAFSAAMNAKKTEQQLMGIAIKLVFKYFANLAISLFMALVYFLRIVFNLIVSYGEPLHSAIAFILLVATTGLAVICTYLVGLVGTVIGGGFLLHKLADKRQALEDDRSGARRLTF